MASVCTLVQDPRSKAVAAKHQREPCGLNSFVHKFNPNTIPNRRPHHKTLWMHILTKTQYSIHVSKNCTQASSKNFPGRCRQAAPLSQRCWLVPCRRRSHLLHSPVLGSHPDFSHPHALIALSGLSHCLISQ